MEVHQINFLGSEEQSQQEAPQTQKIKAILDENQLLPSLSPQTIRQILVSFKISLNSIKDQSQGLRKIKDKLIDIMVEQKYLKFYFREECANYLMLPKFNNLSQPSKNTLKQVLLKSWLQYKAACDQKEKTEKYSMFFCKSKKSKEIQSFHLGLFNFFKMSFLSFTEFPFNPLMNNFTPTLPINNIGNNPQYGQFLTSEPENQIKSINSPFKLFEKNERNVKIQEVQMNQFSFPNQFVQKKIENYENMPYPFMKMPINENMLGGMDQVPYFDMFSQVKKEEASNTGIKQVKLTKNIKTENSHKIITEPERKLPAKKQFSLCKCRGKQNISESEPYFQCEECFQKLHFICLKIPSSAQRRPQTKLLCPLCQLKKNNLFYTIVGEPIEHNWIEEANLPKTKILIKGKKSRDIFENSYAVQLRLLKITGRNMFTWPGDGGVSPKASSFNQILIEDTWLKKNGDDIKISLDHLTPASDKSIDPNKKSSYIFYVVFMAKQKSSDELMCQSYEKCGKQYLQTELQTKNQDKLMINIMDDHLNPIQIPVRGIDCHHSDIFDLKDLVSRYTDLRTKDCMICQKKITNLKIDQSILKEIDKIKSQYQGNYDMMPTTIYYNRMGQFEWKKEEQLREQQEEGVGGNERDNDDEVSLSMGNIEQENEQDVQ